MKMRTTLHRICNSLLALMAAVCSATAVAAPFTLNNSALFSRCFSQLTQTRLPLSDPMQQAVKTGAADPIQTCLAILDSAKFTAGGGTRIASPTDPLSQRVLQTFQKIHSSWFENREIPAITGNKQLLGMQDIYDTESPSFYFTRSLFRENTELREVLTFQNSLQAVRTDMNPTIGASSLADKSDSVFGEATPYAPRGELLGIRSVGEMITAFSFANAQGATVTGNVSIGKNFGGGVLGDPAYLSMNVFVDAAYRSDGGIKMPRKWARAVYQDLLCRPLPVIRREDAIAFVSPTSAVEFRGSSGCAQCHASMDRMASVIRGFKYQNVAAGPDQPRGGNFIQMETPTLDAEQTWPTAADPNYFKRPTNGVLYFRNYLGELVNINVSNLNQLGAAIAQQDDFYICAAKRYYHYFMGIDVSLEDIGDPEKPIALNSKDQMHRQRVIQLGLELKQSQSVRSLIQSILSSPEYKKSDFGQSIIP